MNTSDIAIMCFDESGVIKKIQSELVEKGVDIELLQFSDGGGCGGCKVIAFETFGWCGRCLPESKLQEVIKTFQSASFSFPELAVLLIDCDNNDEISKVYLIK